MPMTRIVSTTLCFVSLALVCTITLQAQPSRPNLSGRWIVNIDRSKIPHLDPAHRYRCCYPKSWVVIIDHREPDVTISIEAVEVNDQGTEHPFKEIDRLTTDGRDMLNQNAGHEVHDASSWEGSRLVTRRTGRTGDFVFVYTLSADGKTLTREMYISKELSGSTLGEPLVTSVFDRQGP